MSRGWQLSDLFGIGNLSGDPDPLWGGLSGENAIKDATKAQQAALEKAFNAIQEYTGKAIAQQQPYTQFAGPDFQRMRGLVQSGYFQTPYGQSFQPQQYAPSGFSMNPGQGMASFQPQSFRMNGYTPQGLPPMPNLPAYQPPPAPQGPQGGLMGSPQPGPSAAAPLPPQGTHTQWSPLPMEANLHALGRMANRYANDWINSPFTAANPMGSMVNSTLDQVLPQMPKTGNGLIDAALSTLDPRAVGNTAQNMANKTWNAVRGLF